MIVRFKLLLGRKLLLRELQSVYLPVRLSLIHISLQLGFRFPGHGFREGPHDVTAQVDGVDDVPLPRAGFFQDCSVRRAARDERGSEMCIRDRFDCRPFQMINL